MESPIPFVVVLVAIAFITVMIAQDQGFAQDQEWFYGGVQGKATWIGGPLVSFLVALLFLIALIGGLHYLRNRKKV